MATVYSLICWGGRDGKTATANTSTDYLTITAHGIRTTGIGVQFTAGTLPTVAAGAALALNTTYYAKYISANEVLLYREAGLTTAIDFTSTGSGLVLKSALYQGYADKSRWTTGGTERTYGGLAAWNTARNAATGTSLDTEFAEHLDEFDDWDAGVVTVDLPSAVTIMAPEVDGVKTPAWHGGNAGRGYIKRSTGTYDYVLNIPPTAYYTTFRDMSVAGSANGDASTYAAYVHGIGTQFLNNYVIGLSGNNVHGLFAGCTAGKIVNNTIYGFARTGLRLNQYIPASGTVIANNLATKNNVGIEANGSNASQPALIYGNVSVGNTTTNWGAQYTLAAAAYNFGESTKGAPWNVGAATGVTTMTTSHFVDWTNNDFRPTSTSPACDGGTVVFGMEAADMAGNLKPSYNNGGAEAWDAGPFEFDRGYVRPLVRTIDFSGLVAGSQVIVYATATTTELFRDNNCSTTESYDAGTSGVTVDYTILKMGYDPIRVTGVALTATSAPVVVQQKVNRAWVASSGLTYTTDLLFTAGSPNTLKLRIASTLQNAAGCLYEAFIDSATNTALKNVAFPLESFGEASFTLLNGCQWRGWTVAGTGTSNTSIALLSRDGMRYSTDGGVTITEIWAAILTLNTPAGQQVKYRQSTAGSIVNASNTGPMDQLVHIYSSGNFDYRDHMVLRAPKPGWSQPQPDLVATYGNLVDGLFVAALEPVLQYATTDADIDAAHLALDNTAKTYTITAPHTLLEGLQRAQWWANQDAQWDADIPLTTTDGSTFTQPSNWAMSGVANLTGGTLAGGSATLAAGTQGIAYNGVTLNIGAAGTYTFTMAGSCTVRPTPTAPSTYSLADCTINGTLTVNNLAAHAITVEVPSGTTTSTTGNTGGAITFVVPAVTADISITSMPNAAAAARRLQIINASALTAAARVNSTAYALGALRLRQTGIGTELTAGLYLRCTTAGTSAGAPPTWNTTPGGTTTDGTAVWTTYSVLYYDADPAATSLTDSYIDGEEFASGESVEIRFAEMDAATSFKVYDTTTIASAAGFSVAVAEDADDVYATNALDGSAYEATFSPNFASGYIVLDANTDFSGKAAYAYFCYTLTSSNGMYSFWGGVTALDAGNYRIESDILNLYFDESAGFVKQTDDVRIFRKDGTRPAIDPTTGGSGIEINWRTPVSVVSTGGSALTLTESSHLLALSNAPSAATVADAVHDEVVEGGKTFRQITKITAAALAGTSNKVGSTITFKGIDGTTDRIVGTFDAGNNRTGATLDGS